MTRKVMFGTLPAAFRCLRHKFFLFPSLLLLLDMMHKPGDAPVHHSCSQFHALYVQCSQWLAHSSLSSRASHLASAPFVGWGTVTGERDVQLHLARNLGSQLWYHAFNAILAEVSADRHSL